ncbi:MAG: nucleotidyltransferase domain-containing protein [Firmicutes bacterium]|nr:nucleotidyltransferase domain-containing protein [Bacillota bacterium]
MVGAGGDRSAATQRIDPQAIAARLADLEQKRAEALRERAREKARLVADILKERYGARQVILYGSLARGDFREGSDIDLLVEGLSGSYWDAYLSAERVAAPFVVSLVCSEDASPPLVDCALKEGVRL